MVVRWTPPWRPDLGATLAVLRHGGADPAFRVEPGGAIWRASRTPLGPGAQRLHLEPASGAVVGAHWGAGAPWLAERLPALLGGHDADSYQQWCELVRPSGLATHRGLAELTRRFPGWRIPRTEVVYDALLPAILEQKVTGGEARDGWAWLLRRVGEPLAEQRLVAPPEPDRLRSIASWEFHRAGIGPERAATLLRVARAGPAVERMLSVELDAAASMIRTIPGIGAWTVAEVMQRAVGSPDHVSFGDFHVGVGIVWALSGDFIDRDIADAAAAELLEPFAGHRYRVQRLLELGRVRRPRRGPRYAPLDHRNR